MADIPIKLIVQQVGAQIPTQLAADLRKLSTNLQSVGGDLSDIGARLSAFSLAGVAAIGATIKAASDWESAFAGVRKTVTGDLTAIEAGLLKMAKNIPVAAEELAHVAQAAGQLGIAKEDILEFTETIARLGVSTNLSTEEAAMGIARFMAITSSGTESVSQLGSALVYLGNNFATTEQDIMAMAVRLAKAGETAGLTRPEILGLAAALSSVGIEAEAGGSAAGRVLIGIQVAAREGGEALAGFASVTGLTAEAFRTMAINSPADALQTLVTSLHDVKKAGGDVFGILESLGIKEQRERDAVLGLMNAHEKLRDALKESGDAARNNVALMNESNTRFETFESKLKLAKEQAISFAREIGTSMLPTLKTFIDAFIDAAPAIDAVAKSIAELPAPVKLAGAAVVAAGVLFGAFLLVAGQVATGIASMIAILPSLTAAFASLGALTGLTFWFDSMAIAMGVSTTAMVAMTTAAVALGAALVAITLISFKAWSDSVHRDIDAAYKQLEGAEATVLRNEAFMRRVAQMKIDGTYGSLFVGGVAPGAAPKIPPPSPADKEAAEAWKKITDGFDGTELRKKLEDYNRALSQGIKFTPDARNSMHKVFGEAMLQGIEFPKGLLKEKTQYLANQFDIAAAEAFDSIKKIDVSEMFAGSNEISVRENSGAINAVVFGGEAPEVVLKRAQESTEVIKGRLETMAAVNEQMGRRAQAAYRNGQISLDEYIERMIAAKDPLSDLEIQHLMLDEWVEKWGRIGEALQMVGSVVSAFSPKIGGIITALGQGVEAGTRFADAFAQAALKGDKAGMAMAGLSTAVYAFENGALAGAAAGAQLGSKLGIPFGTAIGAAAGALLGWVGKAARAREEARKLAAEIEKNRTAFIDSAGGMALLAEKAESAGLTLDRLFQAKTVKEYEDAVKELTKAFDAQKAANEALDAAMEKYGISIEQLGPKFAQQRLDEMAIDLLQDFELLKGAGVDLGLLYEKMGPAFNEYVQKVVASGATIPEALRPVIEEMIRLGLLTDAAGEKITDINQLNFAATLTENVRSLISAIYDLVSALTGIPREVTTTITTINRTVNGGGGEEGGGTDPGATPAALGAYVSRRQGGSLYEVGEGGSDEVISPVKAVFKNVGAGLAEQLIASGAIGGGRQPMTIYVQLPDGSYAKAFERAQKRGELRILPSAVKTF